MTRQLISQTNLKIGGCDPIFTPSQKTHILSLFLLFSACNIGLDEALHEIPKAFACFCMKAEKIL